MTSTEVAFPQTWRVLGLGVAAGYAVLGSFCFVAPTTAARNHGLMSPNEIQISSYTTAALAWIGARDLSFAAALFALYAQGKPREMGTVILSGVVLCVTDVVFVYRYRQDFYPFMLAAGASFWMWIGWRMYNL